jgi:glycoside hydrolase family 25
MDVQNRHGKNDDNKRCFDALIRIAEEGETKMEEKQKVELTLPNPLNIAVQVPGLPGKDGKSAYEVAVERGFVGTVDEWLESLHGQNGSSSEPVSMNFPTVYQMMKARAMKVDSDSLEDVLRALLREVIPDGRYTSYLAEFKLVDGTSVAVGDTVVHVDGQPGFYVVDTNGNRQMIPDSGRLDFALMQPFDGNEKILTMEYPNSNEGIAASLTIPAVQAGGSEEELFNENGVKIYKRADGQAVIEFPAYAMFDTIYSNPNLDSLHFDSLELNELSSGDDITITGMMLLAKLTTKVYFPRDKEMPRHIQLPSQPDRLNLEFRRKGRAEGYADDVFSWAKIDCDGSTWDNGVGVSYSKQDIL